MSINTEVRLAWRRGLEAAFMKEPDQVVPYKLLPAAVDAMKQVVSARLLLFNGRAGRAPKKGLVLNFGRSRV